MARERITDSPLKAFNETIDFEEAYKWDVNDINKWFIKVVNGVQRVEKSTYDLPDRADRNPSRTKDLVPEIRDMIKRLSRLNKGETGDLFKNLAPAQHIYREYGKYTESLNEGSKFEVVRYNLNHIGHPLPYWSPYDLVGLFLGIVGVAPAGATLENFFLPLTAMYGKWCSQIAGHEPRAPRNDDAVKGGVGDWPACFQCTWHASTKDDQYFVLGASLAGYDWQKKITGEWEIRLARCRFELCQTANLVTQKQSFDSSPIREYNKTKKKLGLKGTRYGNCGETYPLASLFREKGSPWNKEIHGLALERRFLEDKNLGSYNEEKMKVYLRNPCFNCEKIIVSRGGVLKNFEISTARHTPRGLALEGEDDDKYEANDTV